MGRGVPRDFDVAAAAAVVVVVVVVVVFETTDLFRSDLFQIQRALF